MIATATTPHADASPVAADVGVCEDAFGDAVVVVAAFPTAVVTTGDAVTSVSDGAAVAVVASVASADAVLDDGAVVEAVVATACLTPLIFT